MLKILFCGLKNEYGDPNRGVSFEYKNLFDSLKNMEGVRAEHFATDDGLRPESRDEMNRRLIAHVEETKPDLLFCFLFTEEIKKETIGYITLKTKTKTFNWFGDDHWRFEVFSKYWAPLFTAVSTTDSLAYKKCNSLNIGNVIKTQWATNPFLYKPQDPAKNPGNYNVTFYGQKYGNRGKYIDALKKAGLPAEGYGFGWPKGGGTDVQKMLDIYSYSKINLNFSETPYYGFKKKVNLFAKLFVKKDLGKYRLNLKSPILNLKSAIGTQRRTIKSRIFDVAACGGFLLTGYSDDDISEYYIPGKQIEVFKTQSELLEKSRYYLAHEKERQAIAQAGYHRTLQEHTYPHRFEQIFKFLNLM